MKPFVISCALAGLLLHAFPAAAQQQRLQFNEQKPAPREARARLPRGAKSLRFGTLKIGSQNSDVLIHIYRLGTRKVEGSNQDIQVCRLDLLRRRRVKGRTRLARLSTLKIDSYNDVDPAEGSLSGQWLDTKRHRIPVLLLQANGGGGFGTDYFVFVFAGGLNKPPIIQKFGSSYNPGQDGNSFTFDAVDERGFMVVNPLFNSFGAPPPVNELGPSTLYWSGKKFDRREIKPQTGAE
jgi:hypothetical protein